MKMNNKLKVLILIIVGFFSTNTFADEINLEQLSMKNKANPFQNVVTGGQPSIEDLKALKEQGVTNIINLRPVGEFDGFNEAEEAKKLGLKYTVIPVASFNDISVENATILNDLLKENSGKTLVHCASSNRVGALFAVKAKYIDKKNNSDAISEGKSAGMYSLEKKVLNLFEQEK